MADMFNNSDPFFIKKAEIKKSELSDKVIRTALKDGCSDEFEAVLDKHILENGLGDEICIIQTVAAAKGDMEKLDIIEKLVNNDNVHRMLAFGMSGIRSAGLFSAVITAKDKVLLEKILRSYPYPAEYSSYLIDDLLYILMVTENYQLIPLMAEKNTYNSNPYGEEKMCPPTMPDLVALSAVRHHEKAFLRAAAHAGYVFSNDVLAYICRSDEEMNAFMNMLADDDRNYSGIADLIGNFVDEEHLLAFLCLLPNYLEIERYNELLPQIPPITKIYSSEYDPYRGCLSSFGLVDCEYPSFADKVVAINNSEWFRFSEKLTGFPFGNPDAVFCYDVSQMKNLEPTLNGLTKRELDKFYRIELSAVDGWDGMPLIRPALERYEAKYIKKLISSGIINADNAQAVIDYAVEQKCFPAINIIRKAGLCG